MSEDLLIKQVRRFDKSQKARSKRLREGKPYRHRSPKPEEGDVVSLEEIDLDGGTELSEGKSCLLQHQIVDSVLDEMVQKQFHWAVQEETSDTIIFTTAKKNKQTIRYVHDRNGVNNDFLSFDMDGENIICLIHGNDPFLYNMILQNIESQR